MGLREIEWPRLVLPKAPRPVLTASRPDILTGGLVADLIVHAAGLADIPEDRLIRDGADQPVQGLAPSGCRFRFQALSPFAIV